MSTYEKAVKGATKLKLAPPKAKYITHLLSSTRTGEAAVAEVFRTLTLRLRDSTWTIAFKALIVVHLLIREGEPNVALSYLSTNPRKLLGVNTYSDGGSGSRDGGSGHWREVSYKPGPEWVQTQGKNIRHYSIYLIKRAEAFQKARCDYVRDGAGRLSRLSVDKGLLRETEAVQDQIMALLKCDFLSEDTDNEISVMAFRLLVQDLRPMFTVMNEGTMNVLEHYFEMSRPDAERSLDIYKNFTKLTDQVIKFLNLARQFEHVTKVDTPKLKHAPTSLTSALEDYLKDPDFELNRRQYLAEKQGKKGGMPTSSTARSKTFPQSKSSTAASSFPSTSPKASKPSQPPKGPPPDLIDFFDSIEQNQQPMAQQPGQYQQPPTLNGAHQGFQAQSTGFDPQQAFGQQQTGFLTQKTGFAPQQSGFPQQQDGFSQQQTGFPPQQTGFPSQQTGFPQQQTGFPQQQNGFSQQQTGFQQPQQAQQTGFGGPQTVDFNSFPSATQQDGAFSPQQQMVPQQTGFQYGQDQQSQPPQQKLQPQFTGAGFGGYSPQPPQQSNQPNYDAFNQPQSQPSQPQHTGSLQRQPTNPFRQSMLPNRTGSNASPFGQAQTTGAFGMNSAIPEDEPMQTFGTQPSFSSSPQQIQTPSSALTSQSQSPPQPQPQPLQPQRTGTNPFARQHVQQSPQPQQQTPTSPQALMPQRTGTNPFRQTAFVNQNTGQGWQNQNQGTMGGMSTGAFETTPVFPRPAG